MNRPAESEHSENHNSATEIPDAGVRSLKDEVTRAVDLFIHQLEDQSVTNMYQMVLAEVEPPLLQAVMRYTSGNQSKASTMLGLNRGTLRTKLKQYDLLK
ncbi:MAG: DNA-binding transcriptional regulator Fis [SAR86 cluster bacterium]|uniref:Putative Fis-like DNA-binding protein n=1 Tax=SAR86 cluster bacterium TaxID=2030880 RepID=A0A2A4ML01_9GAMM|nr:MAG: DNA-binding transcriptional regulator Fis [SAR86 cluster bacterium]